MSSLLEDLRVLESVDQLEFFLLHFLDLHFVHLLLVSFSLQFFFDLGADSILLCDLFDFALALSILLLVTDHQLDLLGFGLLSGFLLLVLALNGFFFQLGLVSLATGRIDGIHLLLTGCLGLLLLLLVVHNSLCLLLLLLSHSAMIFRSEMLLVSAALSDDLVGSLPCLIDLFVRLQFNSNESAIVLPERLTKVIGILPCLPRA